MQFKGAVTCFHCCCSTKLHLDTRAWKTVSLDVEIPALLSSLVSEGWIPCWDGNLLSQLGPVCVCRFERDRDRTEVELCLSVEFIMTPAVAYWLSLVYMFSS